MTSFQTDIAPLFREADVKAMRSMFDLHSFKDVRLHADEILETVEEGTMPCDTVWPPEQVAVLKAWIAAGCPE